MAAARSTLGQPARKWAGRTQGGQKKFHEIHWLFGAMTAVLVLKDGELHVYESSPGFLKSLLAAKTTITTNPESLLSVEEQNQGPPTRKDPSKAWNGRTLNAMKKAHEIHVLYGAQTAGLIFNKDKCELMLYESQQNLVAVPDGVKSIQNISGAKFTRVRNKRTLTAGSRQGQAPSLRSRESDVLDSSILESFRPTQSSPPKGTSILRIGQYFSI
ncbi:hypothetical protein C7999DRAFT_36326 [Corynascus novoguineensis]|uniref:Uncharacterized protein n=1 Tax=Corynascus novoguineensis TaxID=1126955 RepID=A0AAN7HB55_9PEZI|nr:hypothetical protein C7999DRAFT_36326 [Corynascus novoguineensis]